ncbi:glycosyltransferase family 2 protein [Tenacibaculum finnmarkense]|uniref:glycosyltransferase family 2 protein n=1 Tax=Tenacibaculum finnmarkense TaxID=2781243 RepID=UPI001E4FE0FC|nr:glycosyltransferase family 2 protein [Tenacibaculum finnmarkense]MCD8403385.1 glycosyltransferase family 2 protein [Tenacibaculum finnmarkense genomovar finnmarkense]MCD8447602.1 glycosyltransferase family 2 protein [Tenacibaculum finnmarkense genomovar finnmarkense]MCG8806042.1 glycosyltransferase family 2 protein [Tenacibaculum finnmarkense]MCG8857077.1 glycosyltransferase family 2 protein [Tenacibaculum finnmarkense]WCC47594.1 glycosyltransferase family 2 protein [Tenacibaculum finnmarke
MDVSFIIPAYNIEPYLERCIKSIVEQPFSGSYEVVIVDDCSTDATLALAKNIADKHEEVCVIEHRENKKASQARATGFKHSKGEYVWYIDGDDWIGKNVLQSIYDIINVQKLDVLLLKAVRHDGNKKLKPLNLYGSSKNKGYLIESNFMGAVVAKFIRRDCINDNYVLFSDSFNSGDDYILSMELFYNISKVELLDEIEVYYYFTNLNSITQTVKVEGLIDNYLTKIIPLTNKIKHKYSSREFKNYDQDLFNGCLNCILKSNHLIKEKDLEFKNRLTIRAKEYSKILGFKKFNFNKWNIISYRFIKNKSIKGFMSDLYHFVLK